MTLLKAINCNMVGGISLWPSYADSMIYMYFTIITVSNMLITNSKTFIRGKFYWGTALKITRFEEFLMMVNIK